jgi:hypothetical protein
MQPRTNEDRVIVNTSRWGGALLLLGGVAVLGLMAYTLALDISPSPKRVKPAVDVRDVAVFFADRTDWKDFRLAIAECAERDLLAIEYDGDDHLLVKTPNKGHLIRFVWHGTRGRQAIAEEVRRVCASSSPPLAVVGSGNTALTLDLAAALRDCATRSRGANPAPVLLVPWATSVLVPDAERTGSLTPLLSVFAGHTFRFCPNNGQLADLVTRCALQAGPAAAPTRVVIVLDDHDPYSVDLAACFQAAIRSVVPSAQIESQGDPEPYPGLTELPGTRERQWAEELWNRVGRGQTGEVTWVVLPLQAEPAKRLLLALRGVARASSDRNDKRLRVLCGDSIGADDLAPFLGPRAIPIWAASPASAPAPGLGVAHDVQVPAEITSAIIRCIDDDSGDDLRAALLRLSIPTADPATFGRSIAFEAGGERRGSDLGIVLAVLPGQRQVLAYRRTERGGWGTAVPVTPSIEVAR